MIPCLLFLWCYEIGWVFYSFMQASLLSLGLLFYYLFKNYVFFGVKLWAFFM